MSDLTLVTADTVCSAVESAMVAHVPLVLTAAGLTVGRGPGRFNAPRSWRQVPTLEALRAAARDLPAGAVTSPGMSGPPERTPTGYASVFRVEVGVFDRGDDWNTTATRIRTWAAVIRAAAFVDASLGGVSSGLTWVSESYRRYVDGTNDRTLGGCSVEFDVRVDDVLTFASLPFTVNTETGVVRSTHHTVTTN